MVWCVWLGFVLLLWFLSFVQGNSSSSAHGIHKVVADNGISEQTVMGTALMERMMGELSTSDKHVGCCPMVKAEKFLLSLFRELGVPVSKKELRAILDTCETSEPGWFDFQAFRALIRQQLPECKIVGVCSAY